MKITGLGNASVKIQTGNTSLFFDPYQKELVKVEETAKQREARRSAFLEAENVLITHGHFDHLGSVSVLYGDRKVRVFCTKTPAGTLIRQGFPKEKIYVVTPGERLSFDGVTVKTYHTEHCRFNAGEIRSVILHHHMFRQFGQLLRLLRLNAAYPSGGECLLYEICGEGLRVQLLGSAGLDKSIDYPTGADALILPYQGRSDMLEYCMELVERLKPGSVILDHFDDSFPPMTCVQDTGLFLEEMRKRHPEIPCCALEERKTIVVSADK